MSEDASDSRRSKGPLWAPQFVLIVSLAITILAGWYVNNSSAIQDQARFRGLVDAATDDVSEGMGKYIAVLRGAAGLFAAFGRVSPDQFHSYITESDVQNRYPGFRAVGFAPRVSPAEVARFTTAARTQIDPHFKIWPSGNTGDAYPVAFLEPVTAINRNVIGFDLSSEPTRRAAIERARDTGVPALTGKLALLSHGDSESLAGFLVCVPIYVAKILPQTEAERRDAFVGFVYGAFVSDNLFHSLINTDASARLDVRIYSGSVPSSENLLHHSSSFPQSSSFTPRFNASRTIQLAGGTWTLQLSERPDFKLESGERLAPFIYLGGIGIGLVLFAVTRRQSLAQIAAQKNAADLLLATQALKASQARLRRLVDANLIGVIFFNSDRFITEANDEFLRIIGRTRESLGRPVHMDEITSPSHREHSRAVIAELLKSGVCPPFEFEFLNETTGSVPVLIGVAAVEGAHDSGAALNGVAFVLDLTESKRAQRDLQSAKETAESANRAKDQFLAVLSHELRTPLTPVLAIAANSSQDDRLPADIRDEMAMIHRNVELEARLIDDLLDLTRVGRGKLRLQLQVVDLHEIIGRAMTVCSQQEISAKRLRIEPRLLATNYHVRGDPARLQQVFWNLLKNAIKFTPDGGRISIHTTNEFITPESEPSIVIEVVDNGIGIEAEALPKIFDAFEQGSAARAAASGGLGLGLAISRGLVEAHGGAITASSDGISKGSTFTIRLSTTPTPIEIPSRPYKIPPPSKAPSTRPMKILLVEDHRDTARILAKLLTSSGHHVQIAPCVSDAIATAATNTFDVLLTDIGLPDGSGFDVLREIRLQPHHTAIPAIALTGYGAEQDHARTAESGFCEHLTKPISFEILNETIHRAITRTNQLISDTSM